jgi:hypothetical protein
MLPSQNMPTPSARTSSSLEPTPPASSPSSVDPILPLPKLAVHATLLKCLATHRVRTSTSAPSAIQNAAHACVMRHMPALLQDFALTAADAAAAAYMVDVRSGADTVRPSWLQRHQVPVADWHETDQEASRSLGSRTIALNTVLSQSRPSQRAEPCSEAGCMPSSRQHNTGSANTGTPNMAAANASPSKQIPSVDTTAGMHSRPRSADAPSQGQVLASANGLATEFPAGSAERSTGSTRADLMDYAVAPAFLDARLGSTRALERFRNHVGLAAMFRRGYGDVIDIYEDRHVPDPDLAAAWLCEECGVFMIACSWASAVVTLV